MSELSLVQRPPLCGVCCTAKTGRWTAAAPSEQAHEDKRAKKERNGDNEERLGRTIADPLACLLGHVADEDRTTIMRSMRWWVGGIASAGTHTGGVESCIVLVLSVGAARFRPGGGARRPGLSGSDAMRWKRRWLEAVGFGFRRPLYSIGSLWQQLRRECKQDDRDNANRQREQ